MTSGIKIKEMRVTPVAIADPPLRSSYGLHQPYALRNILEFESEDGVIGVSETYGGEAPREILLNLGKEIVGSEPHRLTGCLRDMLTRLSDHEDASQTHLVPGENPVDANRRTYAAIEVGCLDLIGKSLGKPVCDLLGGRVRDRVPFSAYPFYKHTGGGGEGQDAREDKYGECLSPETLVGQVIKMREEYGFKSIKFKAGVFHPDQEIETIKQLYRELGPEIPLRIDPNSAWTVDTSVHVGRELAEELGRGGYLEDPTATISGMSEVRRRLLAEGIDTPLATNVAVTCFDDLPGSIKEDAAQIILCDHHYWGGMREVQHLAKLCQTFDLGLSMHSNNHLGISLMGMAHVAAATPHLTYACDTHYPWQTEEDEVVIGGRVPIVKGCVEITDEPGLGVELDYDQLARGRERYEKYPYRKRDDTAEMRKHVDPDWERKLPRW